MGTNFSKTTHEEFIDKTNTIHNSLLEVRELAENNKMSHNDKFKIEKFFSEFMDCMFYNQVTESYLNQCIHNHVNNWTKFNPNITLDKNKFIIETNIKLKKVLYIYACKMIKYDFC